MTTPIQLMPELLILREMTREGRCCYCHGENGTHFSNCWGPEGQAAWSIMDEDIVISRIEIERLIADNTRLREALEDIACLDPLTQGDVGVRNAIRALKGANETPR